MVVPFALPPSGRDVPALPAAGMAATLALAAWARRS
jgi:hypothetical protein